MGREVKRVPLDFSHPMNETWPGFLNPYAELSTNCSHCHGTGYSPQAKRYHDEWYGYVEFDPRSTGSVPFSHNHPAIAALANRNSQPDASLGWRGCGPVKERVRLSSLYNTKWMNHLSQDDVDALVAGERLWDFTRRPRNEEQAKALQESGRYWMEEPNGYTPTAAEVNEWSIGGLSHDSINCHVCIEARCKRNGEPCTCPICHGEGSLWTSEKAKAAYNGWEPEEPPKGEGWQMWENVSEGSPISPVFDTPEHLAAWLAETGASAMGNERATYEQWLAMIRGPGWAPSMVGGPGIGLVSGVVGVGVIQ